jgi:hypothetical protein
MMLLTSMHMISTTPMLMIMGMLVSTGNIMIITVTLAVPDLTLGVYNRYMLAVRNLKL